MEGWRSVIALRDAFATPVPGPLLTVGLLVTATLIANADVSAQERPTEDATAQEQEPPPPLRVSPRGAFLRALAVPGWGHSAIGTRTRGAFYFTLESATAYTLLRTRRRISDVRERVAFRERALRAQLATEGLTDFDEIQDRLDDDPALRGLNNLQDSRREQQEDLVAIGIFFLFLSGADAYVSAHLARYPDPLTVEVQPIGGGRVELGLRIKLPN